MMQLIKSLYCKIIYFHFNYKVMHITGISNTIANSLFWRRGFICVLIFLPGRFNLIPHQYITASSTVRCTSPMAHSELEVLLLQFYYLTFTESTANLYCLVYISTESSIALCMHVLFLAKKVVKHSTIKSLLSALLHLQKTEGHPDPFQEPFLRLNYILHG